MITTVDGDVIVFVFNHCEKTLTRSSLKDERVISPYCFRSQSIPTATMTTHSLSTSPGAALPGVG